MKITVDPNTDVGGFGYAEAGEYRLRVVDVTMEEGPAAPYLNWKIEFADPNIVSVDKNKEGKDKKLGNIFEITTLSTKENAQFRLRQLCDALSIEWTTEIDTDDFTGREFQAHVGVKEYEGTFSNEIKKYIPAE